ncbi:MAG: hypothetical protein VX189_02355, partial [Planctomycetota bacterium]|nr:hypothetical protein [Planctomycetota bacterium]
FICKLSTAKQHAHPYLTSLYGDIRKRQNVVIKINSYPQKAQNPRKSVPSTDCRPRQGKLLQQGCPQGVNSIPAMAR